MRTVTRTGVVLWVSAEPVVVLLVSPLQLVQSQLLLVVVLRVSALVGVENSSVLSSVEWLSELGDPLPLARPLTRQALSRAPAGTGGRLKEYHVPLCIWVHAPRLIHMDVGE